MEQRAGHDGVCARRPACLPRDRAAAAHLCAGNGVLRHLDRGPQTTGERRKADPDNEDFNPDCCRNAGSVEGPVEAGAQRTAQGDFARQQASDGALFGGAARSRTGLNGFAIRCITALLPRHLQQSLLSWKKGKPKLPFHDLEREKSLELSTSTLARLRSTN